MSKKYKKHTFENRLMYMKMMKDGYSSKYIHRHFGIDHTLVEALWIKYNKQGPSGLLKKKYIRANGKLRETVVRDIEDNKLTLHEAVIKYDVSVSSIHKWSRIVRESGYAALYEVKPNGRPSKHMGRPRKKKPEEMTELERLRYENECLRTENALLKKVRALVEERNARLQEIGRKPSKN